MKKYIIIATTLALCGFNVHAQNNKSNNSKAPAILKKAAYNTPKVAPPIPMSQVKTGLKIPEAIKPNYLKAPENKITPLKKIENLLKER